MIRVLIPVDGSESSEHAVKEVIKLAKWLHMTDVHVLNAQLRILSGQVIMFVGQKAIDQYHQEESEKALKPARKLLDEAGIHYTPHSKVGNAAAIIVKTAQELSCDLIVMGTRGMSPLKNLVLGSTATQVLYCSELPVMLVK
jgi:nucleotide-binding universal stress UspA family protein